MKLFRLTNIVALISVCSLFFSCERSVFSKEDIKRISDGGVMEIMPLSVITDKSDSLQLRKISKAIIKKDIESETMKLFRLRLLATVNDTVNPGVGIAAPQVGVNVKMIYVQRFDKQGEPFEVYYNPVIYEYGDSIKSGREGCLSVPGVMGYVDRSQDIVIEYLDSTGISKNEKISGFTAVIFQHEIDHLNGILYFDRISGGYDSLISEDPN
jgi:peptide deformylase